MEKLAYFYQQKQTELIVDASSTGLASSSSSSAASHSELLLETSIQRIVQTYHTTKEDLSVKDNGIIMRGSQVMCIPYSLQRVLVQAHDDHLGMSKA